MSIGKLDSGTTESHGGTCRQRLHLHLQLRSGRLHSGKRVGTHGNLHHLRKWVVISVSWKEFKKIDGRWTPTHKTWLKTKRDLLLLQESRGNPSLGSAETETLKMKTGFQRESGG